jgi:SAM-dependent methyltransferase
MTKVAYLGAGTTGSRASSLVPAGAEIVSIDILPLTDNTVVHDLNMVPYPFDEGTFTQLHLDNVLEHLGDIGAVLTEIHRISAPGANVIIIVPSCYSKWSTWDPTHTHHFNVGFLDYYCEGTKMSSQYQYSAPLFRKLDFQWNRFIDKNKEQRRILDRANIDPDWYLDYFPHKSSAGLGGLEDMTYVLEVIK